MKETSIRTLKRYGITFILAGTAGAILVIVGDLDAGKFAVPAGVGAALAALGRAVVDHIESKRQ